MTGPASVRTVNPTGASPYFPAGLATRHDTWHALGLRGTASHDLEVDGLDVPVWHTAGCMMDPPRHDGPLWRLPAFALLNFLIAGFPLGIARRALDEFAALAPTKRRGSSATTVAEDGYTQYEFGRCEAAVRSARAFVFDMVGDVWTTSLSGDAPTEAQIAELYVASQNAVRAGHRSGRHMLHLGRCRSGLRPPPAATLLP